MRLKLYTRRIEFINGKEKLYRDRAVDKKNESIEDAKNYASTIINNWKSCFEKYGKDKSDESFLGINFKIKDLDSKEVIETFEIRF